MIAPAVIAIIERLQQNGFAACIVGGAVRDMLLGRQPKDFDIVTTAKPEDLTRLFPLIKAVGASFGVFLLDHCEIACARLERNYLDGRRPEIVQYTDSLQIDVERRDFTINAMLYDPIADHILDYTGGQKDLDRGIIRTVGDPKVRFDEDYLRMLRAVRFAARFRFAIEGKTMQAIREDAIKTRLLAGERVNAELTMMLLDPYPDLALELLKESGILAAVLPEIAALSGVEQPPDYHPEGDVFVHTKLMLQHMAYKDKNLAWSTLLHDIGKTVTRSVEPGGRIRFFGHEAVGCNIAEDILSRLHFANNEKASILSAIRNHMRFATVKEMKSSTLKKLMADDNFNLELELHRLDCISCHRLMDIFVCLLDRLIEIPATEIRPEPLIKGGDLIAIGFVPGPRFKVILEEIYDLQLSGKVTDRAAALAAARKRLTAESGSR